METITARRDPADIARDIARERGEAFARTDNGRTLAGGTYPPDQAIGRAIERAELVARATHLAGLAALARRADREGVITG